MALTLTIFDSDLELNRFLARFEWEVSDVHLIVGDKQVGVQTVYYLLHPDVQ
jgi:hypothetical protein